MKEIAYDHAEGFAAGELKHGPLALVTDGTVDPGTVDVALEVSPLGDLTPIVATVYLQLFAYHIADLQGRSIDKPRNLAKSVTVE